MAWQSNLFNNLLVVFILVSLAVIVYCKVAKRTLMDVVRGIKEAWSSDE